VLGGGEVLEEAEAGEGVQLLSSDESRPRLVGEEESNAAAGSAITRWEQTDVRKRAFR
jgi:hypothetical protein